MKFGYVIFLGHNSTVAWQIVHICHFLTASLRFISIWWPELLGAVIWLDSHRHLSNILVGNLSQKMSSVQPTFRPWDINMLRQTEGTGAHQSHDTPQAGRVFAELSSPSPLQELQFPIDVTLFSSRVNFSHFLMLLLLRPPPSHPIAAVNKPAESGR